MERLEIGEEEEGKVQDEVALCVGKECACCFQVYLLTGYKAKQV